MVRGFLQMTKQRMMATNGIRSCTLIPVIPASYLKGEGEEGGGEGEGEEDEAGVGEGAAEEGGQVWLLERVRVVMERLRAVTERSCIMLWWRQ
jgi:hypothetical protein